ncbi:hypothetical protein FNF27_04976 [Cafeteria roenbergensis]|uniref:Uncharacterized protein n=1 Tax=Cafeteria roenbergensis TaxID=33653 RepID=A0A5A8EC72_CAFRO|nr:hypothetical protein FNF29_00603 [Cafeteria roenbergensis]KAA0173481.1 hypothetical protein FNF27_04976 [Cafeteria roenbergensis]|eukprot:KAA0157251.1 hypothetical protein FNF29_00603 [Cafeteria roenbergensis]
MASGSRLHAEAERRRRKREQAVREAEEAEAAKHPFHPCVNPDGPLAAGSSAAGGSVALSATGATDLRPLHERAYDMQRAKEEAMLRRRLEAMTSDDQLTFQPRILKRSEALVRRRRVGAPPDSADVSSRLFQEGGARQDRLRERRREHAEAEAASLTFEPQVNATSAQLVAASERMQGGFLERQREFVREKERRLELARDAEAEACTFKPATRGAGALLAMTRPELAGESERDRADRLATGDAERARKLKAAISDEYYSQFSFKPAINPLSRQLGRARSVEEHARDEERKLGLQQAKDEAEREEMRRCTFQPSLESDPDRVLRRAAKRRGDGGPFRLGVASDPDAVGDRVQQHLQQKEARARRLRRAREYEELEACTFVPKPAAAAPQSDKPVAVRGLARHLEKTERADRLREDRATREREAFVVRGAAHKAPGEVTVPLPFHLETEESERRMARVARQRAEAEAAAMRECRFAPDTGGISRELQAELLDDGDEPQA